MNIKQCYRHAAFERDSCFRISWCWQKKEKKTLLHVLFVNTCRLRNVLRIRKRHIALDYFIINTRRCMFIYMFTTISHSIIYILCIKRTSRLRNGCGNPAATGFVTYSDDFRMYAVETCRSSGTKDLRVEKYLAEFSEGFFLHPSVFYLFHTTYQYLHLCEGFRWENDTAATSSRENSRVSYSLLRHSNRIL